MPEENEVEVESTLEFDHGEPVEVKFNAIATPKTKLKNTGGASDLFEIAETGRTKSKKVHQIYKKNDSVEDMAESTMSLMADSSRQFLKKINEAENDQLNFLINRNYTPRQSDTEEESTDLENVIGSLHLF